MLYLEFIFNLIYMRVKLLFDPGLEFLTILSLAFNKNIFGVNGGVNLIFNH